MPTPSKIKMSLLSYALKYAARGWPVLPLFGIKDGVCICREGAKCSRAGKHPMTKHGVKDATLSKKRIREWWEKHPDANIGIATGKRSGLLAFDKDPRNGGDRSLLLAIKSLGALPKTIRAETGGGGHHTLYAYPKSRVRTSTNGSVFGPGIDVLSDGSYFVAPGSAGATKAYKWVTGRGPGEAKLAKLPKAWLAKLKVGKTASPKASMAALAILDGARGTTLTSLAGSMRRAGLSEAAMLSALLTENQNCHPPQEAAEIQGIVQSVCSLYPEEGGADDPALQLVHGVLTNHFAGGRHLMVEQGWFWHYEATHWVRVEDAWIKNTILTAIERFKIKSRSTTASLLDQCLRIMQARLAAKGSRLAGLSEGRPVINTLTGELWFGSDGAVELRKHSPESFLTHCLKIKYDPAANCPMYDKAMADIFSKAAAPKAMVRHWHELVGYAIQPSRNIASIVLAVGKGGNGKTKAWNTVIKLLGEDLVAAQDINSFEGTRFGMASLFGKLLLLDDDVTTGTKLPDGFLKTISETKVVTAEDKYKPAFNFRARALPVLLCNSQPSCADLSYGMQRRLMVIPFSRRFKGKSDDKSLFIRIWDQELPGILNRALEGFVRLSQRGTFELPVDIKRANEKFLREGNPVPAFIDECCKVDGSAGVYLKDFYVQFQQWCIESGITMKQQRKTVKFNLGNLGYKFGHGNRGLKVRGLRFT